MANPEAPALPAELSSAADAILASEAPPATDAAADEAEVMALAEKAVANPPTEPEKKQEPASVEAKKDEPPPEAKAEDKPPEPTPVEKKRIDLIAQREKERLEKTSAADAALEAKRKEWEPKIARAEAFERDLARVGKDPMAALALLEAHGMTDLDGLARAAYAKTLGDKAPADFKADIRLREMQRQIDEARNEAKAAKDALEQRETAAAQRQALETYFGEVETSAKEASDPLVKAYASAKPTTASREMRALAAAMAQANGYVPTKEEVHEQFGMNLREIYDEDSAAALIKRATTSTTPTTEDTKKADATKAAPTLTNRANATPTKPRTEPKTPQEETEEAVEFWKEKQRARSGA